MSRKKFTTNLDEDVIKQIKLQAIKEDTNVSKIIEKLLLEYLTQNKKSI